MGLMMFFMGRGMMGGMKRDPTDSDRSLADLKAEQARLAEKIETLESERRPEAEQEPERVS
jgi:hypothetical protein